MNEGFRTVTRERGIEELRLASNGLRVLLVPDRAVPVVAVCIVYHVGSRNEGVGHTGATHLLEHLMFKGSRKFDPTRGRPIARTLERVGAQFNATTWFDRTSYFETLPAEHLDLALELEADRMRNALLREEDLASEMTVVRNEFERGENDPFDVLLKESFAMAFREHPYHHPTIGWRSDIENASIERLRSFYDTFYRPDNASLILVGSYQRKRALELIARRFGPLRRAPEPAPRLVMREPRQEGERRFVVRRAGEVGWVAVSWRAPEAAHPDTHALAVLADALSGGVTSRLFQRLVEPGLCLDIQALAWQLRDPGLFQVFATLNPPAAHERIEAIIREEVARLKEGLAADEVERAKVQAEAHAAFHRDSPGQVVGALTEAISAADWRFYLDFPERIRAVSANDVVRVATSTFVEEAISVGYFVPRNGKAAGNGGLRSAPLSLRPQPCFLRRGLAGEVEHAALPGGGSLLLVPRHSNETVHLHGSLLAGHGLVPVPEWSAASFIPDMLERGTTRRDRLGLARTLEDRAIEVDISAESLNPLEVSLSARCLARHLPLTLDLLAEMLFQPSFPADEVDKLRTLRLGELAQAQEDTFSRAFEAFTRLVYAPGHPYYRRTVEERRAGLERLTRADLVAMHKRLYGSASVVLALVGDFLPEKVAARVARLLDGRQGGMSSLPPVARARPELAAPRQVREPMADKPNLDVVIGHPGALRRADDDFFAAMLGNAVLGHSTLSSRLGLRLRDREGLTYGVVSRFFGASLVDGPWAATFSVADENLVRGVEAAREEIARYVKDGPTPAELDNEKAALAGSYRVSLATPGGKARELVRLARHAFPASEMDRIPERVLAIRRAEVLAAVRRHIVPAQLSMAVAGGLVANPARDD